MASPTEVMLMHPELFGLRSATPVQRAICRVSDGADLGELWADAGVRAAFRGVKPALNGPPKMLLDIGAIRTAKSLKAAAIAATRSQTANLSRIRRGEQIPRIAVCSTSIDNAKIVFNHLSGGVLNSPRLSQHVLSQTADSITIMHPSGIPVEIKVTAGARAGSSLVGRWIVAAIFDEATLLLGSDDGRVRDLNADLLQLQGRILPGGQIVLIGSTVAPPRGPAHKMLLEGWGQPTDDLVAVWSTGPEAFPALYTPEYVEALDPEIRAVTTRRVFLNPERTWLDADLIHEATRKGPVELAPDPDIPYVIATDPAMKTNAWSLVVLGAYPEPPRYRVALAREWMPRGERLNIREVMGEIKRICDRYSVLHVVGDKYLGEVLQDVASELGFEYLIADMRREQYNEAYLELKRQLDERDLELPPVEALQSDLQQVRRVVSHEGNLRFEITHPGPGRHCDYVPALLRAIVHRPAVAVQPEPELARDARREQEWMRKELRPRHTVDSVFGGIYAHR